MTDELLKSVIQNLKVAQSFGNLSTCTRRKIGVYIPFSYIDGDATSVTGSNSPAPYSICCQRETGTDCSAIHAEVDAIMRLGAYSTSVKDLYIWAETPCPQCLHFIYKYSSIRRVYCLDTYLYGLEYPRVLHRTLEIAMRDRLATYLGIDVTKIKQEDLKRYELLTTSDNSEPERH